MQSFDLWPWLYFRTLLILIWNITNIEGIQLMTNWWAKVNNNIRHPEYEALFYALFGSYNQDQDFNKTIFDIFYIYVLLFPHCVVVFSISRSPPFLEMQCIRHQPECWQWSFIKKKKTSTKAVKLFVAFFLTADKLKILQGVMEEDWPVTVNC